MRLVPRKSNKFLKFTKLCICVSFWPFVQRIEPIQGLFIYSYDPGDVKVMKSKNSFQLSKRSICAKIVSEYDQEIPQSQTADNPVTPRGRAAQPSRDTRKTN